MACRLQGELRNVCWHGMDPSGTTERAARLLVAYWRANTAATDTAEGIRQWWIGESVVTAAVLQQALDLLVSQGRVARRNAADGRERYHWVA